MFSSGYGSYRSVKVPWCLKGGMLVYAMKINCLDFFVKWQSWRERCLDWLTQWEKQPMGAMDRWLDVVWQLYRELHQQTSERCIAYASENTLHAHQVQAFASFVHLCDIPRKYHVAEIHPLNKKKLNLFKSAGIAQLAERLAFGREVLGSNLPLAVPKVTLGNQSSSILTISRYKIGTRSWPGNSELTLRIIMCKQEQKIDD